VREEISAGGVVIFGNAVLLLRRYNGDWVLPKGKVEKEEALHQAAVREVYEESRAKAEVLAYLGEIHYSYKDCWKEEVINKTVHWYLMKAKNMDCTPLKKEGFIEAQFIHMNRAAEFAKYQDERNIIQKAIRHFKFHKKISGNT